MSAETASDDAVRRFREGITAADHEILEAVNRRIGLVRQLHRHKVEQGYPLVDRGREEALLADLREHNPGPISGDGLEELFRLLIEISKREAGGGR